MIGSRIPDEGFGIDSTGKVIVQIASLRHTEQEGIKFRRAVADLCKLSLSAVVHGRRCRCRLLPSRQDEKDERHRKTEKAHRDPAIKRVLPEYLSVLAAA
jgi:hypothetical protein